MEFRRIPFQFTSTDPAKRQAELRKRFGLPKQEKMFIDFANPGLMGVKKESNSPSNSPRLQHRVPIFVEGMANMDKSIDANPTNVDAGKPRVRIVPIEVETPESLQRHRTLSGSSGVNGIPHLQETQIPDDVQPLKSLFSDIKPKIGLTKSKSSNRPKERTIPVEIEDAETKLKSKAPTPKKKDQSPKPTPVQQNGCNITKVPLSPVFQHSLKKIDVVLEKLKTYQSDVEKFSGTVKDKQYNYLDEMLTRLMLDLDDVETMGNEDVRFARKDAIKKVQSCIDLLEFKVNESSQNQIESNVKKPNDIVEGQGMEEMESAETVSTGKDSNLIGTDNSIDISVAEPEVEMKESQINAQEPETVMASESIVETMETDHTETIPVDKIVTVISENKRNLQATEANTDVSDEVTQISSTLEQESEMDEVASVEVLNPRDENGLDLNAGDSEMPEVEMKEPTTCLHELETIEVSKRQTELCQDQSMEADVAEDIHVVGSDEPVSEVGKDCVTNELSVCNEQPLTVLSADELTTSDASIIPLDTNSVESNNVLSVESIPNEKTKMHLELAPCEHSSCDLKAVAKDLSNCTQETEISEPSDLLMLNQV